MKRPNPAKLARWLSVVAEMSGSAAAVALLALTLGIIASITLRRVDIDNEWTYDLVLFAMLWTAMAGAAYTSIRNRHVTAGIALENLIRGRRAERVLALVRFAVVGAFLLVMLASGLKQTLASLIDHKTTLDLPQWPVWVAQASIPVGAAAWVLAEGAKLIRKLQG